MAVAVGSPSRIAETTRSNRARLNLESRPGFADLGTAMGIAEVACQRARANLATAKTRVWGAVAPGGRQPAEARAD
ncbi:hypothetical protein ASA1KI_23330 [Opitutales bacterium ASA1]|nr:hypothetical protein ASA1KI_23330 [Opitutales bacterium ASA1]